MGSRIPKFIPVTDLRQDISAVLRALNEGEEPIVIMQRSRAVAVMISVDTYERMTYEREVLGILAMGDKDIRAAKGISVDQLIAELDQDASKDSK
ncbi:type II toxin-antitoxin system Phd/YefM family antitoxin [Candidatus Bipolaricaulota bacterium]